MRGNRYRTGSRARSRRMRRSPKSLAFTLLLLAVLLIYDRFVGPLPDWITGKAPPPQTQGASIVCNSPYIIDGDTLECGGHRIRLASIDAPEMGSCAPGRKCTPGDPHASKAYLQVLTRGAVTCHQTDTDRYGRTVALCEAGGRDLSCAMIAAGHAVERYGVLSCP